MCCISNAVISCSDADITNEQNTRQHFSYLYDLVAMDARYNSQLFVSYVTYRRAPGVSGTQRLKAVTQNASRPLQHALGPRVPQATMCAIVLLCFCYSEKKRGCRV